MTVHNHGPHEGRGLDCPERLIGDCMSAAPNTRWFTQSAVDELTAGLRSTLEARTAALHRTITRAEKAEAKLREVEALADKWDRDGGEDSEAWRIFGPQKLSVPFATKSLRAVLEGDTTP